MSSGTNPFEALANLGANEPSPNEEPPSNGSPEISPDVVAANRAIPQSGPGRRRKDGSPAQPRDPSKVKVPSVKAADAGKGSSASSEAAEAARKAERRKFYNEHKDKILATMKTVYRKPFELAARRFDIPELIPADETIDARADTMFWCLETYCPDWTKHFCLIVLGMGMLADADTAWAIYSAEMKRREAGYPKKVPATVTDAVADGPNPPIVPAQPADAPPAVNG